MANVTVWTSGKTRHRWASWVRAHAIAFADFRAPGLNVYDPIQARYLDIVGTPAKLTNQYGRIGHTDTVAVEGWTWPDSLWLPANNISVYWHKRKTDATNRQHFTWGTTANGTTAERFSCHAPWSDGKLYVDLGGFGVGQRYDFASLSYSGNQTWGVSIGADGFKAYTNGVQVASSATAASGRTTGTTEAFGVGRSDLTTGQGQDADLAEYAFLLVLDDQSPLHVAQSLNSPQAVRHALFSRQRTYFLPGPNSGLTGPNSPAVWTSKTNPLRRLPIRGDDTIFLMTDGRNREVPIDMAGGRVVTESGAGGNSFLTTSRFGEVMSVTTDPSAYFTIGSDQFPIAVNTYQSLTMGGVIQASPNNANEKCIVRGQPDANQGFALDVFVSTNRIRPLFSNGRWTSAEDQPYTLNPFTWHGIYFSVDTSSTLLMAGEFPHKPIADLSDTGSAMVGWFNPPGYNGITFCGHGHASTYGFDGQLTALLSLRKWTAAELAETNQVIKELASGRYRFRNRTYFIPSGKSASPVVTWRG